MRKIFRTLLCSYMKFWIQLESFKWTLFATRVSCQNSYDLNVKCNEIEPIGSKAFTARYTLFSRFPFAGKWCYVKFYFNENFPVIFYPKNSIRFAVHYRMQTSNKYALSMISISNFDFNLETKEEENFRIPVYQNISNSIFCLSWAEFSEWPRGFFNSKHAFLAFSPTLSLFLFLECTRELSVVCLHRLYFRRCI